MQPYFFPYLGYWQLMNAVDKYVIYDNIQYTKKGWFNRNRFLQNGHDELFTINLEKASDYLDVRDRFISSTFDRKALVARLKNAYQKAPYFLQNFPIIEEIILYENNNLFDYIFNSIKQIHSFLKIKSELIVSSSLPIDHTLKSSEKVKAIVLFLKGSQYINAIGGQALYSQEEFFKDGIQLSFLKMKEFSYHQFNNPFIPGLSIVDVMMFNSPEEINKMLDQYELL